MSRLIKLLLVVAVVVALWKLLSTEEEIDVEYS